MKNKQETHYNKLQYQIKLLEKRLNSPKTDLAQTDTTVIVRMELPVKEFTWNLKDNNILYVIFTKEYEFTDNENIIYTETNYGKTTRRVKLPCNVKNILSESWENGIWFIVFQKELINDYIIDDQLFINTESSNLLSDQLCSYSEPNEYTINDTNTDTDTDIYNSNFNINIKKDWDSLSY